MTDLFASGRIIDLILALVAFEAIGLTAYHRATGRGVAPADFALNLASGVCLMLAVRAALVGAPWWLIGACLAAALLAHVADIAHRWRR